MLLTFGTGSFLVVGAVLGIAVPFIHRMPVVYFPTCRCENQKCL